MCVPVSASVFVCTSTCVSSLSNGSAALGLFPSHEEGCVLPDIIAGAGAEDPTSLLTVPPSN